MSNYGGKQSDTTQYIKQFVSTSRIVVWIKKTINKLSYITLVDETQNVLIPKDLYVMGSIHNPSDNRLKENIKPIDDCDKMMQIQTYKYNFIDDTTKQCRYGILAQDLETIFPSLVSELVLEEDTVKTINYIDLIPIIICKMNLMQNELDELNKTNVLIL